MDRPSRIERLARASAGHAWWTVGVWMAMVAAAVAVVVTHVGDLSASDSFTSNPESVRAQRLIDQRLPRADADTEIVIVRSAGATVDSPEMETAVQDLKRHIVALGSRDILWVVTYYDLAADGSGTGAEAGAGAPGSTPGAEAGAGTNAGAPGAEAGAPGAGASGADVGAGGGGAASARGAEALVSSDRRTTLVPVTLTADSRSPQERVRSLYELVREQAAGLAARGFTVVMTGNATWEHEAGRLAGSDLTRGELIGIPIALVVLLFVFGALVASGVPFILAGASIVITLALISLIAGVFTLSVFAANVVTMMGLAVGIDYTLFVLSRFREERTAGLSVMDAVGTSATTAGRAIVFSGLTVIVALFGLLIAPFTISISMGIGMILVVAFAVVAALTLLPALLGLLGDRVNSLRVPLRRPQAGLRLHGRWARMVRILMRRPAVTLAVGAAVLMALAVPGFGLERGESGPGGLPPSTMTRQGYEMLQEDFAAGLISPILVTLDGDLNDPRVKSAIERLENAAAADGRFQVLGYKASAAGDLGLLELALIHDDAEGSANSRAVFDLRSAIVPAALAGAPLEALVGGVPGFIADLLSTIDTLTPVIFAVVLSLSLVLLLVAFRSLVIAVLAVVMNLLSVGASYGLLTLVFQHGIGAGVLGLQQTPRITSWVPLLLFCVLFGLSMDYQVFLLSRVRERYDACGDTRDSVVFGVSSTAGIITGAALIMVAVFAGMASGDLVIFQQIGFGLGAAIFLDATVVRTLVMPAAMSLLGRWNWYLPKWLAWLPQIRLEAPESAKAPAAGGGATTTAGTEDPAEAPYAGD